MKHLTKLFAIAVLLFASAVANTVFAGTYTLTVTINGCSSYDTVTVFCRN